MVISNISDGPAHPVKTLNPLRDNWNFKKKKKNTQTPTKPWNLMKKPSQNLSWTTKKTSRIYFRTVKLLNDKDWEPQKMLVMINFELLLLPSISSPSLSSNFILYNPFSMYDLPVQTDSHSVLFNTQDSFRSLSKPAAIC